jgi:hypothetical protein
MHDALGDTFAVEMRVLLKKLPVLNQQRAARTGGQAVLIIADGNAGSSRQSGFSLHALLHGSSLELF